MANPIITLTTDYGTTDHLVGTIKGAILNIQPEAQLVDINHHVQPFDLLDGALAIAAAYRYFPPRTVHLVVVDPGVGTPRRPILVTGGQHYFVAPDNGVLSAVYEREPSLTVRHVSAEHYFLRPLSPTFHGRDVFAPVAAWLTKNWQPASFGEEISDYVRFALPKPKAADGKVRGVVLRVDHFGNLMTNLTPEDVPQAVAQGRLKMRVGSKEVTRVAQTYMQGEPNEPIVVLGSSGYLEVSVNRGSAARLLGVQRGAEVVVENG